MEQNDGMKAMLGQTHMGGTFNEVEVEPPFGEAEMWNMNTHPSP